MKSAQGITFRDFEPEDNQKNQIYKILKKIEKLAPKGSSIKGAIKRDQHLFEGNLRLVTSRGLFVAKAKSRNIFSLVVKLQSKVIRQMVKWKETRASKRQIHRREIPRPVAPLNFDEAI